MYIWHTESHCLYDTLIDVMDDVHLTYWEPLFVSYTDWCNGWCTFDILRAIVCIIYWLRHLTYWEPLFVWYTDLCNGWCASDILRAIVYIIHWLVEWLMYIWHTESHCLYDTPIDGMVDVHLTCWEPLFVSYTDWCNAWSTSDILRAIVCMIHRLG